MAQTDTSTPPTVEPTLAEQILGTDDVVNATADRQTEAKIDPSKNGQVAGYIIRQRDRLGINQMSRLGGIIAVGALIITGGAIAWASLRFTKSDAKPNSVGQVIDLSNVAPSKTIGKIDQFLNVNADATFNGPVRINQNLVVNGTITTKDGVVLGQSGTAGANAPASLGQNVEALNVRGNLTVGGSGSFGTGLTSNNITAVRANITNLILSGHFVTGGPKPKVVRDTAALGGTINASGNDSSGSITIRTGAVGQSGTTGYAGTLANITFATPYGAIPHISLTPVGPEAASLQYFISRSTDNFTIQSANPTTTNTSYTFDYIVQQ